jgi:hypothetical protein
MSKKGRRIYGKCQNNKNKKGRERGKYEDYWNPQTYLIKLFVWVYIN